MAAAVIMSLSCKPRQNAEDIKIITHRGYWDTEGSAQNSISSLRNAMDFGAFGTEFDVHVTTDGIPVLFHDALTGNGIVIETSSYENLVLHADKLANGETMPRLDDYLTAWDHNPTKLILEIKSASTPERETFYVEKILETVRRFDIKPAEIEYIAFSWHICKELVRLSPGCTVSYLNGDKTPAQVNEAGVSGIDYHYKALRSNPQWVAQAHDLGLIVHVWTVNWEDVMREMMALGVDYITTDKPVLLRQVMTEVSAGNGNE